MQGKYSRFTRRFWMVAAAIATFIYLGYRTAFTLNLAGPYACVISLSLLVAEMYGAFLMFLYFFQIWELIEPEPVPVIEGRTVDIFIPTYNEDPDLLRGTISAALALDYPHETYVLDDGNRPPVRELCEELGATYINRPTNLHAKAGNLNHAMEITDGEFVVIFDADHVSRRDFITRLIGYFKDDELGFIQTPHSFYNFDNFHGDLNYKKGRYWEEGELFYNVTQPGKNYWNAVSFCGSAAMFRRKALVDVGLVATETITEDMHTGLRMHANGWKSLFVNERLVSGQAANDVTTFNTQRLRWGEGNLGVFAFDNPLTMKGLTFGQRLGYIGSMLSWTTGVQKIQLYAAPVLMLLTGIAPVKELNWTLGTITVVYMFTIWTSVTISSNGHGHLIGTELTHMASFWTQIQSTYRAIFKRRKTKFVVTAKRGRQSNSIFRFIAPQCIYIAASGLAIASAATRYAIGLSNDLNGLCVGSLLVLVHCWFAWEVVRRALREKTDNDDCWRHPCALSVHYRFKNSEDEWVEGQGVSVDINEQGLGFHAFQELDTEEDLEITVHAMGLTATTKAKLVHKNVLMHTESKRDGNTECWRCGVQYVDPSTLCLATIWRLCSDFATARMYDQFEAKKGKGTNESLYNVLEAHTKGQHRINVPISLTSTDIEDVDCHYSSAATDSAPVLTVTESVSSQGCTLLLERCPAEGEIVNVDVDTPLGRIRGLASVDKVSSVILGATKLEFANLTFNKMEGESRSLLLSLCHAQDEHHLSNCIKLRPPEKQLPSIRPSLMLGSAATAAAVLAIIGNSVWHRDYVFLTQAGSATEVTEEMKSNLDEMLEEVIADPNADESHIVQLREVLRKIGDDDSVMRLNTVLIERDVETFSARLYRAQGLEALGETQQAYDIYERLQTELDQASRPEKREFYFSAARNAANRSDYGDAVNLFAQVEWKHVSGDDELFREYIGLLADAGQTDSAIELMQERGNLEREDFLLLGSIYSSRKQYRSAIKQYRGVLMTEPNDPVATHLIVDNAMWDQDYGLATQSLTKWLDLHPNDWEAEQKLAMCYLWDSKPEIALPIFERLSERHGFRRSVQEGFVESCLGVKQLTNKQQAVLKQIAANFRPDREADKLSELLVHALSKTESTAELLPLMERLVDENPWSNELRLRLVDLLETMKRHDQAQLHLDILLARTSQGPKIHSVQKASPSREKRERLTSFDRYQDNAARKRSVRIQ